MSAAPDETVELLRLFDSHSLQSCLRDVIRARRLRMHLHARGLSLSLSLSLCLLVRPNTHARWCVKQQICFSEKENDLQ